ncbi:MAG: hypothetical protein JWN15_538, partial [Firmicutes bacterium]|nr:hypothetical protein [Bacillota bacterium]
VHIYAEPIEAYELVAEYRRVVQDAVLSSGGEPDPEPDTEATVTGEVRN